MKKIFVLFAIIMSVKNAEAQTKPEKIIVEIGGHKYELKQVQSHKPAPKKPVVKPAKSPTVLKSADTLSKTDSAKKFIPKTSIYSQYANGNIVINGTVTGNVSVTILNGDTTKVITKIDSQKHEKTYEPASKKPIEVLRTRAYSIFLDSRKNEKVRPIGYEYADYEPTSNFRKIRKRLKKALYPLEKGAGASEYLLSESGQFLLNLKSGVHNIINVRNAGVVDIYKLGDTLIADFKPDRYSGTDYTGGMRIFYRK